MTFLLIPSGCPHLVALDNSQSCVLRLPSHPRKRRVPQRPRSLHLMAKWCAMLMLMYVDSYFLNPIMSNRHLSWLNYRVQLQLKKPRMQSAMILARFAEVICRSHCQSSHTSDFEGSCHPKCEHSSSRYIFRPSLLYIIPGNIPASICSHRPFQVNHCLFIENHALYS